VVLVVQVEQEVLEEVITTNQDLWQVMLDLVDLVAVVVVQLAEELAKLVVLVVIGQPQAQILTTAEVVVVEEEQYLDLIIVSLAQLTHQP
jgi:hypothetical protein